MKCEVFGRVFVFSTFGKNKDFLEEYTPMYSGSAASTLEVVGFLNNRTGLSAARSRVG